MRRYSEYKDSGVAWIGKIPSHWEVKKINHELELLTDYVANGSFESLAKNVEYLDEPDYAILLRTQDYNKQFEGPFVYISEKSYNFLKKSELVEGDLVISNVGSIGTIFKVPKLDRPTSLAPNAILVRTKQYNDYIYYFIKSSVGQKSLEDITSFTAQPKFNKTSFRTIKILVPTIEEQIKIAEYLDKNTLKIDSIISKKEELIETLKASRSKLISETVTKGFDKNVPMKDSGVEWIGEIANNWEIKKFKYIGEAIIGLTYSPEDIVDKGTLVLRSTNIQNGSIDLSNEVNVSKKIPSKLITQEGDVLICARNGSKSLIGKCGYIDESSKGNSFGAFTMVFRCDIGKFIYYVLNSDLFKMQLSNVFTTTINQLTVNSLNNMLITLPPKDEINDIVNYLDKKTSQIDKLIFKLQQQIDILKKAKEKLITEVVTGKIDVTNL